MVDYKELEWPILNKYLKQLIDDSQREEIILSFTSVVLRISHFFMFIQLAYIN